MIRKLFFLWGAAEDEDGDDDSSKTPAEESPPSTRELTKEEMSAMTAQAADKASRKTRREIAADLGFDSMKELKVFVDSQKEAAQSALDEQTVALQEAERTKKEYEAAMSSLASQRLSLLISQQVVAAGVADSVKTKRIAALIRDDLDPDVLEDEEAWEASVTDALQSVQDDMPELFAKAGGVGSGDGGAHGKSTEDKDPAAEKRKQLRDEFEKKGLIYHEF